MRKFILALGAFTLLSGPVLALEDVPFATVQPHSFETVGSVKVAGVFLGIMNGTDTDDVLVSASSPVAETVELHTIIDEDGVKKMRAVDEMIVPANGTLTLERGGDHIMLMGLKNPLKAGDEFPVTLTLRDAGVQEIVVQVQAQGGVAAADDHSGHADHSDHKGHADHGHHGH